MLLQPDTEDPIAIEERIVNALIERLSKANKRNSLRVYHLSKLSQSLPAFSKAIGGQRVVKNDVKESKI
jgi:hypothetical protein